ncbi:MAG TPA: LamG-like jellyroll fold domain-containing protein [Dongiaceae bacterium]|nr:LamG-like jellyroll fold domain-containing protein [Dongiaceae bacterium]
MKTKVSLRRCGFGLAGVALLLGAAVCRADYQSTVLADSPQAYYPLNLDADGGTAATDVTGNGNNGTYVNIYAGFNNAVGPSAFITNAVSFDGLSTYVDLSGGGNPSLLNFSGPITLEAWVQPSAGNVYGNIIAKGYDSSVDYNEVTLRANNGNYYGGTYSDTNNVQGASGGQESANWVHLALTHDGANWRLYVNSVLVQSNPDAVGAINWPAPWRIGTGSADGASRLFSGNISQVAIYNYGLTADQVLNHFTEGMQGVAPAAAVPIIIAPPQAQSNYLGGTVTFSVSVVSVSPTTNQWFKGATALTGQTNATLTLTNVSGADEADYSVVVGNDNGTATSATASFTLLTSGANLRWSATGDGASWDTAGSTSWTDLGNNQTASFNDGDKVTFDDTVGVTTNVQVSGTVSPSLITVNSSTNNFTFNNNSGTLSGAGGLTKKGTSTLTVLSAGNFTGPVNLQGGVIYAGNNSFASVSGITITNGSSLDLGGGTFHNNKPISVSGSGANGLGAIDNTYDDYPAQSVNLTLTGDTRLGTNKRWDLAGGSQISGPHLLTLNLVGAGYTEWNSPVIGADLTGIVLTNGNFGAKGMDNSFQNPATMLTVGTNLQVTFWSGGWNGSMHLLSGSQVNLWTAPAAISGSTIILEEGSQWGSWYNSGDEPVNNAMVFNGVAHLPMGDHNMIYTNLLSGPGGFVMDIWNHAMVLSASNTYSGPTIIGDGPQISLMGEGSISHSALIFFGGANSNSVHITATGRPDQTLKLAAGQTLAGIGAVDGKLVVSPGATLAPAGTNTTLNITTGANAIGMIEAIDSITLGGTTTIKLNGSGVCDMVQSVAADITYGGTLNLVNLSGTPLAAGDSFPIFSATGFSGNFANFVPTTPGAGLAWDTNSLSSGILGVKTASASGQPVITGITVSGGSLIVSGNNGTASGSYVVLTSTNVAAPLNAWIPVATNSFDGTGAFGFTNTISANVPELFYRLQVQ